MDARELYYEIPKEHRDKIIELPKNLKLEKYENYNKRLHIPEDACYLILMQIGILDPTIMFLDKDKCPTTSQNYGIHLFTNALEKRIGLIFEKVNNLD